MTKTKCVILVLTFTLILSTACEGSGVPAGSAPAGPAVAEGAADTLVVRFSQVTLRRWDSTTNAFVRLGKAGNWTQLEKGAQAQFVGIRLGPNGSQWAELHVEGIEGTVAVPNQAVVSMETWKNGDYNAIRHGADYTLASLASSNEHATVLANNLLSGKISPEFYQARWNPESGEFAAVIYGQGVESLPDNAVGVLVRRVYDPARAPEGIPPQEWWNHWIPPSQTEQAAAIQSGELGPGEYLSKAEKWAFQQLKEFPEEGLPPAPTEGDSIKVWQTASKVAIYALVTMMVVDLAISAPRMAAREWVATTGSFCGVIWAEFAPKGDEVWEASLEGFGSLPLTAWEEDGKKLIFYNWEKDEFMDAPFAIENGGYTFEVQVFGKDLLGRGPVIVIRAECQA